MIGQLSHLTFRRSAPGSDSNTRGLRSLISTIRLGSIARDQEIAITSHSSDSRDNAVDDFPDKEGTERIDHTIQTDAHVSL